MSARLTMPERMATLEATVKMALASQKEKDQQYREDVEKVNIKLDGIQKYISEDSGKNKVQARLWGFGAGTVSGILISLLNRHVPS